MCPVCMTTAVMIACSAASTGGLAAIVIKRFGAKNALDNCSASIPPEPSGSGSELE
jgi:hypothetical protein